MFSDVVSLAAYPTSLLPRDSEPQVLQSNATAETRLHESLVMTVAELNHYLFSMKPFQSTDSFAHFAIHTCPS